MAAEWAKFEKGNTDPWVARQRAELAWRRGRLEGVNLRRARLVDHILPALEGVAGRSHKIRVLMAFDG